MARRPNPPTSKRNPTIANWVGTRRCRRDLRLDTESDLTRHDAGRARLAQCTACRSKRYRRRASLNQGGGMHHALFPVDGCDRDDRTC